MEDDGVSVDVETGAGTEGRFAGPAALPKASKGLKEFRRRLLHFQYFSRKALLLELALFGNVLSMPPRVKVMNK